MDSARIFSQNMIAYLFSNQRNENFTLVLYNQDLKIYLNREILMKQIFFMNFMIGKITPL